MTKLYNRSTERYETAKKQTCPRCKNFGAVNGDDGPCYLCKGIGVLWISESGWTRALYNRQNDTRLY